MHKITQNNQLNTFTGHQYFSLLFYGLILTDETKAEKPMATIVLRKHVSPSTEMFYLDVTDIVCEACCNRPNYGSFVLEFYPRKDDLVLMNKTVLHVLFKKFAQSCWSELCEI